MKVKQETIDLLEQKAYEIRQLCIDMFDSTGAGHAGGSLSEAEIMAALYFHEMRLDPKNPAWEDRDFFLLSKAHACPAYYAALALRGFFDVKELNNCAAIDSFLQAHPDKNKTPGIDMSGGSLGQAFSVACGIAWAQRKKKKLNHVYCLIGDGESQEGQIWEAAMSAAHYKLDNLTAIIDNNKVQAKGYLAEQMGIEPFADKWKAFGWQVLEADGHDVEELVSALYRARWINRNGKPTAVIAHTVKGRGVDFMEFNPAYHAHAPTGAAAQKSREAIARFYGREV